MTQITKQTWLQYIVPLTVLSFAFVTLEYTVNTDNSYRRLFGFPLPSISGEMCDLCFRNAIFIGPLFLDLLTYLAFWTTLIYIVQKFGLTLRSSKVSLGVTLGLIFCFLLLQYLYLHKYSFFLWYDQDYEIIEKSLRIGITPP